MCWTRHSLSLLWPRTGRCRATCSPQELESLIGTLHHFCQIIPPDRAFLRRMINLLCCFRNPAHPIRLNTEFHQDLSWWLEFVPSWAEVSFFFRMPNMMPLPDFFRQLQRHPWVLGPFGVSVATSQCCNSSLSWSLRMFGGTCGCAYRSSSTAIIPPLCLGIRSRCCSFTVYPWSRDHFRSPRVMFRLSERGRGCVASFQFPSPSTSPSIGQRHFHTSPLIRAASLALYKLENTCCNYLSHGLAANSRRLFIPPVSVSCGTS